MKAIALAALATTMLAAPALAGPYVKTKSEFTGTDETYKKAKNQARLGYEWKTGRFAPYVEAGGGLTTPDGEESEGFAVIELGSKVKITDKFGAYGKFENFFQEDDTRDWKVELGTKYSF
jgi:outer membrane autotransporter protein